MINFFFGQRKIRMAKALCAMTSAVLLTTSCGNQNSDALRSDAATSMRSTSDFASEGRIAHSKALLAPEQKDDLVFPSEPPTDSEQLPPPPPPWDDEIDVPSTPSSNGWDIVELMVRTDPANPQNERFLNNWHFEVFSIDDSAESFSPSYSANSSFDGTAAVGLPAYMLNLPMVIRAHNDLVALDCDSNFSENCPANSFEIFIPAYCSDKAIWLLGPVENSLWSYYKRASRRFAEAWNPSQVDCATWLSTLQLLILTDEVNDALEDFQDIDKAITEALQYNQQLLVPTRPPICMAERRHSNGNIERGEEISCPASLNSVTIDDVSKGNDVLAIGSSGMVMDLCEFRLDASLTINGQIFNAQKSYSLDDDSFLGLIHDHNDIATKINASLFNVKLGNGRGLDDDKYDDACALSSVVKLTNTDDDEQDILKGSGVTFADLFGEGLNTVTYLTSDGDTVVDDHDTWAIFYDAHSRSSEERVLAVELLGNREKDYRDVLYMNLDPGTENLFLGLGANYELNEEEVDGESAFFSYTIHTWDGSSAKGKRAIRRNIANCYEAADPWARQFFVREDFETKTAIVDGINVTESKISPLVAAEFAVRSQCFSNSRANQRWRSADVGFWSMNTDYGVAGNVVVNPGWLAADMDFEIYIQRFDEAVFKGPRTIKRSDDSGQLMIEVPTLVEGDRVLIKTEDNCCDDYELVIPCVPEFTGFAGAPGVPFVPSILSPIPRPIPMPQPLPLPIPENRPVPPVIGVPVSITSGR